MSTVSIVFRNDSSNGEPGPGELHVRPRAASDQDRLDVASLVLEQGLDGLIRGDGPIEFVVVAMGPSKPTLDDMLAASFAMRLASGQAIPSGAKTFARYSAVARKGLRPGKIPVEASLEGIFLAIRNSVPDDLEDVKAARLFLDGWLRMFERILIAAEKNVDPFSTGLFNDASEFAEERAFLIKDRNVYRQDVKRGRRWVGRLPNDSLANPPRAAQGDRATAASQSREAQPRVSALILDAPKSLLFKYWARIDRDSPTGDGYLLLGVREGDGTWIFSTDPVQRLSLKSLADCLQKAEEKETPDAVKSGADPWFDGNRFAHSLIASPKQGTRLSETKVLGVVKQWAHAAPARTGTRKVAIPTLAGCLLLLVGVPWLVPSLHRTSSDPLESTRGGDHEATARGDTAAAADFNPEKGKLLVLAIGADYKRRNMAENPCKKDAEKLAAAFQSQQGVFFRDVRVFPLVNSQAKRNDILAKLKEIRDEATEGDLVVVTLAGHGTVDQDNNYFYLPYDYDPKQVLASTGVSWDDFHRVFKPLRCMVLVIADTCHSGAITRSDARDGDDDVIQESVDKAVKDFRQAEAGLVVIAASLSEGLARQNQDHGFLSQAVLEGVTGQRADSTAGDDHWPRAKSGGLITLEALRSYVISRVQTLSRKSQKVITNHSGNIHLDDVPIAIRRTSSTGPAPGVQVAEPGRLSP